MFDFDNTPITKYTKLKAQYNCGPTPVISYTGDWGRITLKNGTVLEVQSEAELNSLLTSTTSATVADTQVQVADITKLEFGSKVTALPDRSVMLDAWSSLRTVSGFAEGLKTIGNYCFTVSNGDGWGGLSGNTIVLPSTVTSVGQLFLCACGDGNLTVIVNCPVSSFGTTNSNYLLSTYQPDNPQYVNGVKIGGRYANEFIAKFPNRTSTPYRNLYSGNTLDSLENAAKNGNLAEEFPVGTVIDDMYDGLNNPLIVVKQGVVQGSDDNYYRGAYLQRTYVTDLGQKMGAELFYPLSTMNTFLNGAYLDRCSDNLKNMISEVAVPSLGKSGELETLYTKWFLPSLTEVYGVDDRYVEGSYFPYWKQKTGYSAPSNSGNEGRVAKFDSSDGAAGIWWLRSRYTGGSNEYWFVWTSGFISHTTGTDTALGVLPCCVITEPEVIPAPSSFDLAGLKEALNSGTADTFFPIGTGIPDTYNGQSNPLIVVAYLDGTNNSYKDTNGNNVTGVILQRSFVTDKGQKWDNSSNNNYGASTVNSFLNGTYLSRCSTELQNVIMQIRVPVVTSSGATTVNAKVFLPSIEEVYGNAGATYAPGYGKEGSYFPYWKEKTGFSSPSNSSDGGRIMRENSASGSAIMWWLRSRATDYAGTSWLGATDGSIGSTNPFILSAGVLPCFVVGKD